MQRGRTALTDEGDLVAHEGVEAVERVNVPVPSPCISADRGARHAPLSTEHALRGGKEATLRSGGSLRKRTGCESLLPWPLGSSVPMEDVSRVAAESPWRGYHSDSE